ncbi:hypothetical protein TCAL_02468 [Tigriopus californicus]|uniref:Uncharacterized protein n=1 Tax=Tigriopus californicus TaxID=6832 RepID=A0A553NVA9_TIGCA|nr:uncharacterized protein LOC131878024 [Tigriopus californicus]TRY69356.1 hypothetical protein TCAL_02468 [Tigriopus californicus]|eukprot:TCALIF_02468-PA protein Name:"Protein of unknown function" AED:0.00 eAED:0.00 QI:121/1/1/1/0.5/0.66/3/117/243
MSYSSKTLDVLEYAQEHPLTCQSEKMAYLPLDQLDSSRLPDVVAKLNRDDIILPLHEANRINAIKSDDKRRQHLADVTMALLYIPCGGLDEAHDIVLPYSWPDPTEQAGQPIKDSPASHESKYAHAFVHRKEGDIHGELGMIGFDNACYWFGTTGYHPLYPVVKSRALDLAKHVDEDTQKLVLERLDGCDWYPDRFTKLCEMALKSKDDKLTSYCSEVTRMEWKLLLDVCNNIVNPSQLTIKV